MSLTTPLSQHKDTTHHSRCTHPGAGTLLTVHVSWCWFECSKHQCFFQDFDEGGGGQTYVNSNFGGACNRAAKRPVAHEVRHMLGRSGGMLPPRKFTLENLRLKSVFLQYEQQFTH